MNDEEGDRVRVEGEDGSGARPYPPALAAYEEVVASPTLFMDTLKNLHFTMGTKFKIPSVACRNLDLHRLFIEVTTRGGISKVVKDRNWKEISSALNIPSSSTNAAHVLRKHFVSLLYNYEQVYFFKAAHTRQYMSTVLHVKLSSSLKTGSKVHGVIDAKFGQGYVVSAQIGSEELKGVLYHFENSKDSPTNISPRNSGIYDAGAARMMADKVLDLQPTGSDKDKNPQEQ